MNFLGQDCQKLEHCRQTDRHTDRHDWKQYHAEFVCGHNNHKEHTALLAKCARVSHAWVHNTANKRTQETG